MAATKTEVALVHIPQETAAVIFLAKNGLDPYIEKIKQEALSFVPDPATKSGRALIVKVAKTVKQSQAYMDGVGKTLVDELKAQPKIIDAERKRMRDTLDQLIEQILKPVTEFNEAETKRVEKIQAAIDSMKIIPINGTLEQYNEHLLKVSNIDVNENFAEFKIQATEVKKQVIGQLNSAIEVLKARELERQELERLRQKEIDEKIEAARQEGIRSAQQAQSVPVTVGNVYEHVMNENINYTSETSIPTTDFREDFESKRAFAQSESYNSMIQLGCPPDYASWFMNAVLSGSIKNIKFTF